MYPDLTNLKPEVKMLLACLKPNTPLAETTPPAFDWHYFLQLSFSHRVFPLIAKKLEEVDFVPAAIQEKLQSSYRANLIKNLILTKTLLDLLNEFAQNNIPVLAFKGAALSQLLYEDVALRHFSDLDILVAETDLPAVRQLLLGQNYQPKLPLTAHLQTKYQKVRYEQDFWQADQNIALDLHWLLLPRGFSFSPSFAQIWQGRQALNLEGQTIQTLAKEAYLLYLCAHAAKSNWVDLSLVADIAALLHFNNLDWHEIRANTGKLATERMLLHGLNLAHHLLDAPLPAEYQAKIKPVNKTCAKIIERLVTPELNSLAVILKHNFFFESLVLPQDKIRYWYNELIVPTPLEWQAVSLAKMFYPVYYLVRPVRLLYKSLTGRF
jgi:Uncharacterised nucleotidyltransferase